MPKMKSKNNWPKEDLEDVGCCPICGECSRTLVTENLIDNVFFCAPGEWSVFRCDGCESGYLDPRPTESSIGRAYERYYTHHDDNDQSKFSVFRESLANGYRNAEYGTALSPSSRLGRIAALLFPSMKSAADYRMRHLQMAGSGKKLLDVGCGDGQFLSLVSTTEWELLGVEPDPKAVVSAREKGLDVIEGSYNTEELLQYEGQLDGITLSHVLEHVHDPVDMIVVLRRLLKKGGWLWIEVPNFHATGFEIYGDSWRGLEPPRHLSYFTHKSLCEVLTAAGFSEVEILPYRKLCYRIFSASESIADGQGCVGRLSILQRTKLRCKVILSEKRARRNVKNREFISIRAKV